MVQSITLIQQQQQINGFGQGHMLQLLENIDFVNNFRAFTRMVIICYNNNILITKSACTDSFCSMQKGENK